MLWLIKPKSSIWQSAICGSKNWHCTISWAHFISLTWYWQHDAVGMLFFSFDREAAQTWWGHAELLEGKIRKTNLSAHSRTKNTGRATVEWFRSKGLVKVWESEAWKKVCSCQLNKRRQYWLKRALCYTFYLPNKMYKTCILSLHSSEKKSDVCAYKARKTQRVWKLLQGTAQYLDVVFLVKASNIRDWAVQQNWGSMCRCAAIRHPSCFHALLRALFVWIYVILAHSGQQQFNLLLRLSHFRIIMWCMRVRNLLNTVPVTAQTLLDINDTRGLRSPAPFRVALFPLVCDHSLVLDRILFLLGFFGAGCNRTFSNAIKIINPQEKSNKRIHSGKSIIYTFSRLSLFLSLSLSFSWRSSLPGASWERRKLHPTW